MHVKPAHEADRFAGINFSDFQQLENKRMDKAKETPPPKHYRATTMLYQQDILPQPYIPNPPSEDETLSSTTSICSSVLQLPTPPPSYLLRNGSEPTVRLCHSTSVPNPSQELHAYPFHRRNSELGDRGRRPPVQAMGMGAQPECRKNLVWPVDPSSDTGSHASLEITRNPSPPTASQCNDILAVIDEDRTSRPTIPFSLDKIRTPWRIEKDERDLLTSQPQARRKYSLDLRKPPSPGSVSDSLCQTQVVPNGKKRFARCSRRYSPQTGCKVLEDANAPLHCEQGTALTAATVELIQPVEPCFMSRNNRFHSANHASGSTGPHHSHWQSTVEDRTQITLNGINLPPAGHSSILSGGKKFPDNASSSSNVPRFKFTPSNSRQPPDKRREISERTPTALPLRQNISRRLPRSEVFIRSSSGTAPVTKRNVLKALESGHEDGKACRLPGRNTSLESPISETDELDIMNCVTEIDDSKIFSLEGYTWISDGKEEAGSFEEEKHKGAEDISSATVHMIPEGDRGSRSSDSFSSEAQIENRPTHVYQRRFSRHDNAPCGTTPWDSMNIKKHLHDSAYQASLSRDSEELPLNGSNGPTAGNGQREVESQRKKRSLGSRISSLFNLKGRTEPSAE